MAGMVALRFMFTSRCADSTMGLEVVFSSAAALFLGFSSLKHITCLSWHKELAFTAGCDDDGQVKRSEVSVLLIRDILATG